MNHTDDCGVAIMAKAPIAGYCKTRLAVHIGNTAAAGIQRRLIRQTIATVREAGIADITLWCAPSSGHDVFSQARYQYNLHLKSQTGNDLGSRMLKAIRSGLARHKKVIVLGTDCPALQAADLIDACQHLNHSDHVFAPAEDGGYVMVATKKYEPALFRHIPWGTPNVMAATRQRLGRLRATYIESPTLWDLDNIYDLYKARRLGLLK